jgi:hypothetical protein
MNQTKFFSRNLSFMRSTTDSTQKAESVIWTTHKHRATWYNTDFSVDLEPSHRQLRVNSCHPYQLAFVPQCLRLSVHVPLRPAFRAMLGFKTFCHLMTHCFFVRLGSNSATANQSASCTPCPTFSWYSQLILLLFFQVVGPAPTVTEPYQEVCRQLYCGERA